MNTIESKFNYHKKSFQWMIQNLKDSGIKEIDLDSEADILNLFSMLRVAYTDGFLDGRNETK